MSWRCRPAHPPGKGPFANASTRASLCESRTTLYQASWRHRRGDRAGRASLRTMSWPRSNSACRGSASRSRHRSRALVHQKGELLLLSLGAPTMFGRHAADRGGAGRAAARRRGGFLGANAGLTDTAHGRSRAAIVRKRCACCCGSTRTLGKPHSSLTRGDFLLYEGFLAAPTCDWAHPARLRRGRARRVFERSRRGNYI